MTYVFIGGCMRSGTTLLQSILCSDSATNPLIPEAQWLVQFLSLYHWSLLNFSTLQQHYFRDQDDCRDFHARVCLEFLEKTAQRYGNPKTLVLKAPQLGEHFGQLDRLVPGSRFLIMVRDPRDTIASILAAKSRFEDQGKPFPLPFPERDMRAYSRFYNSSYRALTDEALRTKVMFVKYEGLTTRPEPVIEKLREFTGITVDRYHGGKGWTMNGTAGEDFKPGIHDEFRTDLFGKGISDKSVARYGNDLTAEEIVVIEEECATLMKVFNYQPGV